MNTVFIVWEYDDGIEPEKTLVCVCDSLELAKTKQRKLKQGMPDYVYEVEQVELKHK